MKLKAWAIVSKSEKFKEFPVASAGLNDVKSIEACAIFEHRKDAVKVRRASDEERRGQGYKPLRIEVVPIVINLKP